MNIKITLPRFDPAKIRAGVRPGKVETSKKTKAKHCRKPKHRKQDLYES